jgi:hypothetical protein
MRKKKKKNGRQTDIRAKANAGPSKHEHIEHASSQKQHKLKREPLHKARRRLGRDAPRRSNTGSIGSTGSTGRISVAIAGVAARQRIHVVDVVGAVVDRPRRRSDDVVVGLFQRHGGVHVAMATATIVIVIIIVIVVVVVAIAIVIVAFQRHHGRTHRSTLRAPSDLSLISLKWTLRICTATC